MPTVEKLTLAQPPAVPALTWVSGKIRQILLQARERFYILAVDDGKNTTMVRFGDPYTGQSAVLSADDPMYSLAEQAFLQNLAVELGVRNFGHDPQAGIDRIVIDRISIHK